MNKYRITGAVIGVIAMLLLCYKVNIWTAAGVFLAILGNNLEKVRG